MEVSNANGLLNGRQFICGKRKYQIRISSPIVAAQSVTERPHHGVVRRFAFFHGPVNTRLTHFWSTFQSSLERVMDRSLTKLPLGYPG